MYEHRTDGPYGTLDLLILKTLDTMGPMHGFRIARRIEQVAENLLRLNQGSIYPALIRLEQQGWIRTQWGISETKSKGRVYCLTNAGLMKLRLAVARLRTWFRRRRLDQELEDEILAHLELAERDAVAAGLRPEEALR